MISCHVARAKWLFRIILLFAEDCWVTLTSPLTGRHHQNQGIFTTWHFLTKTAFFSLHFTKQKQSCQFFYFYNCIQILKKCTENYLKNCVKNVTEEELWTMVGIFIFPSVQLHLPHPPWHWPGSKTRLVSYPFLQPTEAYRVLQHQQCSLPSLRLHCGEAPRRVKIWNRDGQSIYRVRTVLTPKSTLIFSHKKYK